MNPFTKAWFWFLLISIIGLLATFIAFETSSQEATGNSYPPSWIWIIFIVSLIFFVIAFILYYVSMSNYAKELEVAIACGEIVPKVVEPKVIKCCPKPKTECPKQQCVETFIEQPVIQETFIEQPIIQERVGLLVQPSTIRMT